MTAGGLRRVALAGLALALAAAATIAIIAVLSGELGETEGRVILALVGVFLSGAAATAGLELLIRRRLAPVGLAVLVAAAGELALFMVAAWKGEFGDGANDAIKTLPTALAWVVATLVVVTFPLVTTEPRLLRTLFPLVATCAVAAASLVSALVYGDSEDEGAGKALAVLAILMVVGWLLAPLIERLFAGRVPREPPG